MTTPACPSYAGYRVVQNLLVSGYTDVRKAPAIEGRISTGTVSVAAGGWPPPVKLAGAEAIPGPA